MSRHSHRPRPIPDTLDRIRGSQAAFACIGTHEIVSTRSRDLLMNKRQKLPFHTNGMRFLAYDAHADIIATRDYYSVGGGFVVNQDEAAEDRIVADETELPYPYQQRRRTAGAVPHHGLEHRATDVSPMNSAWRSNPKSTPSSRRALWDGDAGLRARGITRGRHVLPGGLHVGRAPRLQPNCPRNPRRRCAIR
jgi:L-serine dehydratase